MFGPERRSLKSYIVQHRAGAAVCEPFGYRQAKVQPGTYADLPDNKGLIGGL